MKDIKDRHGYLILPRQLKLLRQVIGVELFGFYLSLAMEAIWSRKNENFGLVMGTQAEIALKLNMDQATVSRKLKALNERFRYCVIKHKNSIRLGFFPLFVKDISSLIHSKNYANLNQLYEDMHSLNVELKREYANLKDN